MDDDNRKSDKKLPLLTLDNGMSIDDSFYPEPDLEDEEPEETKGFEYEHLVEEERFDCCSHYNKAGWFSRIFFFWVNPIIKKGKLSLEVLGTIPPDESAQNQKAQFEQYWNNVADKTGNSLFKTVFKRFKWELAQLFVLNLIAAL